MQGDAIVDSREVVRRTLEYDEPERVARSYGESDFAGAGPHIETNATEWKEVSEQYWERQIEGALQGLEHPEEMQARAVAAFERHTAAYPDADMLFVSHGDIICFLLQHFAGEQLEPLVHYYRGVNKASLFSVDPGPPAQLGKLFEPIEYGTVYPRP